MEKVRSLIAALGRDQGSMRKVKMNRLTAEWQVRYDVILLHLHWKRLLDPVISLVGSLEYARKRGIGGRVNESLSSHITNTQS